MASLPGEEMYLYNGEVLFATPYEARKAYLDADKTDDGRPLGPYWNAGYNLAGALSKEETTRETKLAMGYYNKNVLPSRNAEYEAARKKVDNWDRMAREERRLHSALDGSFWKR